MVDGPPSGIVTAPDRRIFLCAQVNPYKPGWPTYDIFSYDPNGNELTKWDRLFKPSGIAIGPDGTLFVADSNQEIVTRFSAQGEPLKRWGSDRTAPGWLNYPFQAVGDSAGFIYVSDYAGEKIEKYASDGSFVQQWFSPWPAGIAVTPAGLVLACDILAQTVHVFTAAGDFVEQYALQGFVYGMDADIEGNLYVADNGNNRISEYAPSGDYIRSLGPVTYIVDVAVDTDGTIFALRGRSPSVMRFAPDGSLLASWDGGPGGGIDVRGGHVYLGTGVHVRHFSQDGTLLAEWGGSGTDPGQFEGLTDVALGREALLYAVDPNRRQVQIFQRDGIYVSVFGGDPTEDGRFSNPTDLDTDSRGNVFVADTNNNRVQKFTPEGLFLTKWGVSGTALGAFDSPRGIAVNDSDQVFVWDTGNKRIQVFDDTGGFIRMWPAADSTHALMPPASGLAGIDVGPNGVVYLVDSAGNQVVEFDRNGVLLTEWGQLGSGPGLFNSPRNVAADAFGSIYVTDIGNKRVQRFDYPQVAKN